MVQAGCRGRTARSVVTMESTILSMRTFFEVFGWREVLDILLITLALFIAYRTLRRLGTWKILAGILLTAAVFFLASLLQLRGLEWIFSNLSPVALVALIVIFQPEIRKIFERAASLHRQRRSGPGGGLAGTLAETAFALAGDRVGALLVMPGRESIAEWVHGGHPVDGQPSLTLLQSIFEVHSPGHDGAVIVEDGRLAALGVRLPMSRSNLLPETLGTRHHAAAGLTEVTDALVAVVSEERGTVMLFSGGRGRVIESREVFEEELIAHWQRSLVILPVRTAEGGTRSVALSLIIPLVLAIFFWSAVVYRQYEVRERVISAPVEYVSLPSHLGLGGEKRVDALLRLAGPLSELERLDPFRLQVRVDLSGALPGTQTVVITEDNVSLPRGISLLEADPAVVRGDPERDPRTGIPDTAAAGGHPARGSADGGGSRFPGNGPGARGGKRRRQQHHSAHHAGLSRDDSRVHDHFLQDHRPAVDPAPGGAVARRGGGGGCRGH